MLYFISLASKCLYQSVSVSTIFAVLRYPLLHTICFTWFTFYKLEKRKSLLNKQKGLNKLTAFITVYASLPLMNKHVGDTMLDLKIQKKTQENMTASGYFILYPQVNVGSIEKNIHKQPYN